jgi:hypothetical protein
VKKVKISLRPGSSGKKFYLFPTAEALYVWACAMERGEMIQVPDIEELVLEPGGFIEAELRGFEYAYEEKSKFRRLELVRLGKAQQPKNSSGLLATIHAGWVLGGLMPMRHYTDTDIEVRLLAPADARLDLPALFKDELPPDEVDVDVDDDDEDTGDPEDDE